MTVFKQIIQRNPEWMLAWLTLKTSFPGGLENIEDNSDQVVGMEVNLKGEVWLCEVCGWFLNMNKPYFSKHKKYLYYLSDISLAVFAFHNFASPTP